jgi:hypothetical protein
MTVDAVGAKTSRGSGTGWYILLILVAGMMGAGALARHLRAASRFNPAAEISMEEFLGMKKLGRIREVWLEGSDLNAQAEPDFVRDGESFRFVHAVVPPAYLMQPAGLNELKSGVDPSRFTVIGK